MIAEIFWLTCKGVQTREINGLGMVKKVKFIDRRGEKESAEGGKSEIRLPKPEGNPKAEVVRRCAEAMNVVGSECGIPGATYGRQRTANESNAGGFSGANWPSEGIGIEGSKDSTLLFELGSNDHEFGFVIMG